MFYAQALIPHYGQPNRIACEWSDRWTMNGIYVNTICCNPYMSWTLHLLVSMAVIVVRIATQNVNSKDSAYKGMCIDDFGPRCRLQWLLLKALIYLTYLMDATHNSLGKASATVYRQVLEIN